MKLHELISPIDKHMDTEYGTKIPSTTASSYNTTNSRDLTSKDKDNSNMTSTFTKKNALDVIRSVVKKARGKEPIITTKGGTNISVDAFGGDKSIKLNKTF